MCAEGVPDPRRDAATGASRERDVTGKIFGSIEIYSKIRGTLMQVVLYRIIRNIYENMRMLLH